MRTSSAKILVPSEVPLTDLPPFICPTHGSLLSLDRGQWRCEVCGPRLRTVPGKPEFVEGIHSGIDQREAQIRFAYRLYSIAYPVLAVFALWIVWSGSVRKQIRFFADCIRKALTSGTRLLDVATGDGSMTSMALKRQNGVPAVMVDLSSDMLLKSSGKLKKHQPKLFYIDDVAEVCFANGSFAHVTCFGGINSFSDPHRALKKVRDLMTADGVFSGSYLLRPGTRRRNAFVDWCIRHGLQCTSYTEDELKQLFRDCGFTLSHSQINGRMMMFSLHKA